MYVYMIIIYDYWVVFDYMKLEYYIVKIMYVCINQCITHIAFRNELHTKQ